MADGFTSFERPAAREPTGEPAHGQVHDSSIALRVSALQNAMTAASATLCFSFRITHLHKVGSKTGLAGQRLASQGGGVAAKPSVETNFDTAQTAPARKVREPRETLASGKEMELQ
ncbi:MAG TPA: hypothetical protein VF283_05630 [Bryobacteraceae bacterium]